MKISEMDNETLFRYYICAERELKNKQSEIKQIKEELDNRYNNGTLGKKE